MNCFRSRNSDLPIFASSPQILRHLFSVDVRMLKKLVDFAERIAYFECFSNIHFFPYEPYKYCPHILEMLTTKYKLHQ